MSRNCSTFGRLSSASHWDTSAPETPRSAPSSLRLMPARARTMQSHSPNVSFGGWVSGDQRIPTGGTLCAAGRPDHGEPSVPTYSRRAHRSNKSTNAPECGQLVHGQGDRKAPRSVTETPLTPTGPWFNRIARFLGPAYLRNAFTKGTEQEVAFLVDALGLERGARVLDVGC